MHPVEVVHDGNPLIAAGAVKGPFTFSVEVPVSKWKAMRLKNLPKDAVVGVKIETSGEVGVSFLDSTDYLLFPKPVRPVFQGRVQKKISFSVRKWQKIFVPHMQTAFLERLKKKASPWTDLPLIEKELAARR